MNPLPQDVDQKKRRLLGPTARYILKISNWEINGEIPNYNRMVLVGVPHTAMRDAWYGLLTVLALDLKASFFGAKWVFTRLPSPITFSKNLDRLGIPWPLGWLQKKMLVRLGGIPVYRTEAKGHIRSAIEEFSKLEKFVLVLTPEGGTDPVSHFRSGFYFIAKDMNIPYIPIEIDFKNRSFNVKDPHFITGSFEEESLKLEKLFEGVEGATRTFTMLKERE
jgi:hypothetical protein